MDSLIAIGLGLALRAVVDQYHNDYRIGGILVGMWEGAVLHHFVKKRPRTPDPYWALLFRMLVDLLVTENFMRMAIITLWSLMGWVLSDLLDTIFVRLGLKSRHSSSSSRSSSSRTHRHSSRRRTNSLGSQATGVTSTSRARTTATTTVESPARSVLPFPFWKSLRSSRVHFYELPAAPESRRGDSDDGSSVSSDATVRSPRSILRSPSTMASGRTLSPHDRHRRRVVTDPTTGSTYAESESGSDYTRSDISYEPLPPRRGPRYLNNNTAVLEMPVGIMKKPRLRSEGSDFGGSVASTSSYAQVIQPVIIPPAAASDDGSLEYLDEDATDVRQPTSIIVLPPVTAGVPPPLTLPTSLPDMHDIPEISIGASVSPEDVPLPSAVTVPPLADIPDIGDAPAPPPAFAPSTPAPAPTSELSQRREKPSKSELSVQSGTVRATPRAPESTLTRPPPYEENEELFYEHLQMDAKSGLADAGSHLSFSSTVGALGVGSRRSVSGPEKGSVATLRGNTLRVPARDSAAGMRDSMMTTRTSVLMGEVEELRAEAEEREKEGQRLAAESSSAAAQGRVHEALLNKVLRDEAEDKARMAMEKAEQKLYRANNRRLGPQQIDVRGLRGAEAVRRTEKAIAEAYERGEAEISIIVGQTGKMQTSLLKQAVQKSLRSHRINFSDGGPSSDSIQVTLPYPTS